MLAVLAVVLVLNPLTLELFVSVSFTRTAYLLLFDALAVAVVVFALRHIRWGRRQDLVGAIGLMAALPAVMLLAERPIVALDERVSGDHAFERELSFGDSIHRADPLLGWVPIPGATGRHVVEGTFDVTYQLDDLGRKAIPADPGATRTVHFFGNLFTFGHGVANKDTALNLVAEALGPRANIANWGVMGYGLEQMFLRLRAVQDQIQPGDVVIFTPLAVDLLRNMIAKVFVCGWIYRQNYSRARTFPMFEDAKWRSVRLEDVCPTVDDLPVAALQRFFLERRDYRSDPAIIENADRIFAQAKAIADRHHARFEVLFLTMMSECQSGRFAVPIDRLRTPVSTVTGGCPPADQAETYVFPIDSHLNPAGNRWLARAILEFLNREGLNGAAAAAAGY